MKRKTKVNARSLANLQPAKPGEIKNPLGINRKNPISDRHAHRAEELLSASPVGEKLRVKMELPTTATWADAYTFRAAVDAASGDVSALREITDRVEGTSSRRLEISTPAGRHLRISVKYDRTTPRPLSEDER